MKCWIFAVGVLLLPTAASAQTPADAKRMFAGCQHCHQPPDLNLAIDRAWLDQIKRTA
ncbi:MAG: hypothetical protein L0215_01085 [Gemmataceae bacterium]|nr:hypothetical protein [Gemmataceae bacterium]